MVAVDDNVHPLFEPDPVALRRHLGQLFQRCAIEYPEGRLEIAWSKAGAFAITDGATFPATPDGLERAVVCAVEHNRRQSNVYVGVNPRNPSAMPFGRCNASDVEIAFFQFVECDKPESLELLRRPLLPFSFTVITGHSPNARPHCYYELAAPLRDMALWRSRQEALRDYFGGDNVVDPPRVMRLAGTVNYPRPDKAGRGYRVEIVQFHKFKDRAPVTGEALARAYGPAADDAPRTSGTNEGGERPNFGEDDIATAIEAIRACPHSGGGWHNKMIQLVARLVSRGYDPAVILGLAPHLTVGQWTPAQTLKEMRKALESAQAKGFGPDKAEEFAAEPAPLWQDIPISEWATRPIPPREWVMEDWIPVGQCVGLYGVPGVRKTDFLIQLMMAASLKLSFCGVSLAHVQTYGLFCEDSEEEIARRAMRIAGFYGRRLEEFTGFHYASLVGASNTEFVAFGRSGGMVRHPAYLFFEERIAHHTAGLAVLDTAPDFFGGDEVRRRQVIQFIRSLDGVGMQHRCAILFSAHPSKSGISSGQLDSGSTGWEGKVRARLTLHDPASEVDDEPRGVRPMSDRRVLTRAKSNYAAQGETIELILLNGGLAPAGLALHGPKRGPLRDLAADAKFLDLLDKVRRTGAYVHDGPSTPARYAPAVFAGHPEHGDFSKAEFARAMRRLFTAGRIRLVEAGRARNPYREIVAV
jgi:RecA-family ATPase